MKRPRKIPGIDYTVGYRRTPIETRFQPGVSGNPKGRPKKPKTVGRIIDETLKRKIFIEENGRRRRRSLEEIIILNLVNAAAKRDLKAIQVLFSLRSQYADGLETIIDPGDLPPEDAAIIRDFMARTKPDSDTPPGPGSGPEREQDAGETK